MRSTVHPILRLVIVGVLFAAIASIAARRLYQDEQFEMSTHRSLATIEQGWTTHGSKSGTFYHTRYHFLDDKGHLWTDSVVIGSATYWRIQVGMVVPAKYIESIPIQSRIDLPEEASWHWHQDEILAGIAGVLGLVIVLILISWRRY